MSEEIKVVPPRKNHIKSYVFKIELEPDEEGWRAFYSPLEHIGASRYAGFYRKIS